MIGNRRKVQGNTTDWGMMRSWKRQEKNREKRRKGGILEKGSGRDYYLHETNEKNARRERKW